MSGEALVDADESKVLELFKVETKGSSEGSGFIELALVYVYSCF